MLKNMLLSIAVMTVVLCADLFANSDNLCKTVVSTRVSGTFRDGAMGHAPENLFDGIFETPWGLNSPTGWIEFDLTDPRQVQRIIIDEGLLNRITGYIFKAKMPDGTWKELVKGDRYGYWMEKEFPPCNRKNFRLEMTKSSATPGLWQIELYNSPAETFDDPRRKVRTEDPDEGKLHPMLEDVIKEGPFKPKWVSLVTHPTPDWFINDKVGLSACWGVYAVPGWTPRKDSPFGVAYAEWYWEWLLNNNAVKEYHKKHYGDAQYDDFIDGTKNLVTGETEGFYAEKFDADEWMNTFKKAGVKYFYITSKHHDGFCIWDSQYTDRNSMKMGPKRDLYGEMVKAARKHGLKIGLYYSFYEWHNPMYTGSKDLSAYKGFKKLNDEDGDGNSSEYVDDFMVPQLKELIDKYNPDYLCFDGEWDHGYLYWRSRQITAYFYNRAAKRGQEVIVNDRYGHRKEGLSDTRGVYGDFRHVEHYSNIDRSLPWALWRGFGNSYGYNRNEHPGNILTLDKTIEMLVDVVADNGNIEFNIGPKADGTLPEFELERLAAMGEWLDVNGESIYGTKKGPLKKQSWGVSTVKGNNLYLHIFDWPKESKFIINGVLGKVKKAYFLHEKGLPFTKKVKFAQKTNRALELDLEGHKPFDYVSTLCVVFEKEPEISSTAYADEQGIVNLNAMGAELKGELKVETPQGISNIGCWNGVGDSATWKADISKGEYDIIIEMSVPKGNEGNEYSVAVGGSATKLKTKAVTEDWRMFKKEKVGRIKAEEDGEVDVIVKAEDVKAGTWLMNLRNLELQAGSCTRSFRKQRGAAGRRRDYAPRT